MQVFGLGVGEALAKKKKTKKKRTTVLGLPVYDVILAGLYSALRFVILNNRMGQLSTTMTSSCPHHVVGMVMSISTRGCCFARNFFFRSSLQ